MTHAGGYSADPRVCAIEWLPWLAGGACFFLLPEYLPLGARILIYILYALSLDLILGYAGIITLGHSAFFGAGAYAAGILGAKLGVTDPFLQLAAAALAAGGLGLATGAIILRTTGLTLLMLTLALLLEKIRMDRISNAISKSSGCSVVRRSKSFSSLPGRVSLDLNSAGVISALWGA